MQLINALMVSGLAPVTVGGLGVTLKQFPFPYGAGIGLASTQPGYIFIPGSGRYNGQLMRATVGANVNSPAGTVQFQLIANTAKQGATPVNVVLAQTTAFTPTASTTTEVSIVAELIGSTASGAVGGTFRATVGNTAINVAPAALTNALAAINFNSEYPFSLSVGVLFGTTSAANTASLFQFALTD